MYIYTSCMNQYSNTLQRLGVHENGPIAEKQHSQAWQSRQDFWSQHREFAEAIAKRIEDIRIQEN